MFCSPSRQPLIGTNWYKNSAYKPQVCFGSTKRSSILVVHTLKSVLQLFTQHTEVMGVSRLMTPVLAHALLVSHAFANSVGGGGSTPLPSAQTSTRTLS